MYVSQLTVKEYENEVRYSRYITYSNGESKEMWISCTKEIADEYCSDRADGYLVSLLLPALKRGEDIVIESPVSESLYFSITKYLIPFLLSINDDLHSIQVICDTVGDYDSPKKKCVGTGISCGVDSLSTFLYHKDNLKSTEYNINCLTLFNSGYYGIGEEAQNNYNSYKQRSAEFCKENKCELMLVNSNFYDFRETSFLSSHTYLTCSIILLFQGKFSIYYYSSGYPVNNFKPDFHDPAYYDVFLLQCISTKNLRFISSCTCMTRVEKVNLVLDNPKVSKYLYVCTAGGIEKNCGKCEKCIRTLLEADAVDKLQLLPESFDIVTFKKKRAIYQAFAIRKHKKEIFYNEIYEAYKRKGGLSILSYLLVVIPSPLDLLTFKRRMKRWIKTALKGKEYDRNNQ